MWWCHICRRELKCLISAKTHFSFYSVLNKKMSVSYKHYKNHKSGSLLKYVVYMGWNVCQVSDILITGMLIRCSVQLYCFCLYNLYVFAVYFEDSERAGDQAASTSSLFIELVFCQLVTRPVGRIYDLQLRTVCVSQFVPKSTCARWSVHAGF